VVADDLVDVLAAYRLTRLVTTDTISDPFRDGLLEQIYRAGYWGDMEPPLGGWSELARSDEEPPKLAELLTCWWCAGWWISAAVVAARRLVPGLWGPVARALATSTLVGLLAKSER
jgi:hypothetical protein